MKFLVDAQLPPVLCGWLRDRGHEASHVADLALLSASDAEIAAIAEAEGFILITKDEDFVQLRHPDRFGLVWLRCGNATNAALSVWLAPRWQQVEAYLLAGDRFIETR